MAERRESASERKIEGWTPRTKRGKMVLEGQITSMEEIFAEGLRIREPEIADVLLPNLEEEVLDVSPVFKQTDAGHRMRFKAVVAVGNREGFVGLGSGKAKQVRNAIDKGATEARINVTMVRRGCGSWECGCGRPHSLPFQVRGKCGGVEVVLLPGPRGLGLVAGETTSNILRLAGVRDCWTRSYGPTKTIPSLAFAVFDALRQTYRVVTPSDWVR